MNGPLRVGIVLLGVPDLRGGGGAERYFLDLLNACRAVGRGHFAVSLVTDRSSLERLRQIGRAPSESAVELLQLAGGGRTALSAAMCRQINGRRFDVVHIAQALPRYLPWLWWLRCARAASRPAVVLNVNDARLAPSLIGSVGAAPRVSLPERAAYTCYFRSAPLDGILSWYEAFVQAFRTRYPQRHLVLHAARYCFVDTSVFRPARANRRWVVFSGRLVDYKRPLLYVEAIAEARRIAPVEMQGWRFFLIGRGPLERTVRAAIAALDLGDIVELAEPQQLKEILARSQLFVSTQDIENFTSLAMLEAMASGNAVIARDVGQTRAFVRPGENGLLATGDTSKAVGATIVEYLRSRDQHETWQRESRRIATDEHCAENVVREFEEFWTQVIEHR